MFIYIVTHGSREDWCPHEITKQRPVCHELRAHLATHPVRPRLRRAGRTRLLALDGLLAPGAGDRRAPRGAGGSYAALSVAEVGALRGEGVPMPNDDDRLFRRTRRDGSVNPVWYGWYYDSQGRQITKSTRHTDRRAAARVRAQWERDAAEPDHARALRRPRRRDRTSPPEPQGA